jgi:hypothetical protein
LVFVKYKLELYKRLTQLWAGTMERVVEKGKQIAVGMGFEEKWFSDSIAFCGENENAALIFSQYERDAPLVVAASHQKNTLNAIKKAFKDNLNMESL